MDSSEHFNQAPITEAVIDLRVTLPDGFTVDSIDVIHKSIIDRYPSRNLFQTGSLTVEMGEQPKVATEQSHFGFQYASEDGRNILQASMSGFAFNRLAPYERWETFRAEAKSLWDIYRHVCAPSIVTRIAVRYINRLDLPTSDQVDMKHYLRTYPEVSPDMPQLVTNFFMQMQMPQTDLGCMLNLTQASLPAAKPGFVSLVLDFDLYREGEWVSDDDEGIWGYLDVLRIGKNRAFRASITDATKELIA